MVVHADGRANWVGLPGDVPVFLRHHHRPRLATRRGCPGVPEDRKPGRKEYVNGLDPAERVHLRRKLFNEHKLEALKFFEILLQIIMLGLAKLSTFISN